MLAPFGYAYGRLAHLRRRFYSTDLLKSEKLPKAVVSIGNLTVGGTGKTPVVDAVLDQIEKEGKRACVLTRGYGRKNPSDEPLILKASSQTSEGGDEPLWLARRHPRSVIAVGSDRIAASRIVSNNIDIFILDDGLQHLRIKRDLDIVLLDCTRPLWHYRPLPWGYGREDFSSLKSTDIIILTRVNQAADGHVSLLLKILNGLGLRQIHKSQITVSGCEDVWTSKEVSLAKKRTFLVSGIGNPESFEKSALDVGADIVAHEKKGDHFDYNQKDIEHMVEQAKEKGAEILLLTEKDAIKWQELSAPHLGQLLVAKLVTTLEFNPPLPRIYELAVNGPR